MSTATCPYCRTAIAPGEASTTCGSCGLPYHAECWRENGGCATYGCAGHRIAPRSGDGTFSSDRVEVELEPEPTPMPRVPRWRRPRPDEPPVGEPLERPLMTVLCEALGLIGAVIGAIVGAYELAREGAVGVVMGLIVGAVLGLLVGTIAVPLGLVGLTFYLAELAWQAGGPIGALFVVLAGLALFAVLMRTRVRTWPPIFPWR